ncbi:MAG: MotA/TolQ/ExbB proton channel family protein [Lachnospiraceae bacterium]|nr:MotA/TolQ/ExbB proton channel family protein [Lachnospiraceae bacterium]
MNRKKWYEWIMLLVYILLLALCVYLTITGEGTLSISTIAVNAGMFLLVGIILLSCERRSFRPISRMTDDLIGVTEKIRQDAMHAHRYLYEEYKEKKEELFTGGILRKRYQDYQYEMDRIARSTSPYYRCDIEDYISEELVDHVIHRDILNQVAGVMTGLGILGTFIGLTLGLQSFNTGTTAEITNSIEPLMRGIKVAFHTSIYGMVFSLTFNFVYKRRLSDAEAAVRAFLDSYRKYVLPDTTTDGINRMMGMQKEQTDAVKDLTISMAHQISEELGMTLEPQFNRFDKTIRDFGNMATKNQMDALSAVVNAFVKEMNTSLDNSFKQLSETISDTLAVQKENDKQIQMLYAKTAGTAESMETISRQTEKVVTSLERYSREVHEIERQIGRTADTLREQGESAERVLSGEKAHLSDLRDSRKAMDSSVELLTEELKRQSEVLKAFQKSLDDLPKNVDHTFHIINENLQDVERHFQKSVLEVKNAVERVPEAVAYSYEGIEQGFDRAARAVESLSQTVEEADRRSRLRMGKK